MRHLLLILSLPMLLSSAANAVVPPSKSFLDRPTLIPIEVVKSGHIGIHARINGRGPYRFIFDTGAPSLVISEQVARDSRIITSEFHKPFFTPMGNLGEQKIRSITVGNATQKNIVGDVWNHPTVEILGRSFGRFEGLIGFPFFAHYQLTIDYKSKTMTLVPCKFEPEDTRVKMVKRMSDPVEKVFAPAEAIGITVSKAKTDQAAGVEIATVLSNSPAAAAGLKHGDRLLTLDGRWTDSIDDCYAALSAIDSPRAVAAVILRNGSQLNEIVQVKPGI